MAWLAAMALYWPGGLSFQDDVGYVGEAKILQQGRLRPLSNDPGVWVSSSHGSIDQYMLLPSLLLLPFVSVAPRSIFLVGISAAVLLCLIAGRILKSWDRSPTWALLLLAHPTIALVARTAMADLPLAAFALAAWWSLRQKHRPAAILMFVLLLATKPTGLLLGLALAGGEILRLLSRECRRDPESWRRARTAIVGIAVGILGVCATNELTTGSPRFAYDHHFLGTPPFWPIYLTTSGSAHLRTLLLFPPLLIVGVLPWWRRFELGPVCLIVGFGTMMCFYFFVDFGITRLESMVLAPRLILPVVVFLLIGYADVLAGIAKRFGSVDKPMGFLLIVGTAAIALAIGFRHSRWQTSMKGALLMAMQASKNVGNQELGVTPEAAKAGMLFPGPTRLVDRAAPDTAVVLCSTRSASYREPTDGPYSCALPGYTSLNRVGDYEVLIRR